MDVGLAAAAGGERFGAVIHREKIQCKNETKRADAAVASAFVFGIKAMEKFSKDTWDPGYIGPMNSGPGGKGETWPPVGNAPVPDPRDPLGVVPNINKGYNEDGRAAGNRGRRGGQSK